MITLDIALVVYMLAMVYLVARLHVRIGRIEKQRTRIEEEIDELRGPVRP